MGSKTGIEWTDATWNPITGCSRVSEGCRNCYAERFAHRFSGEGQRYEDLTHIANGHPAWTGKIQFNESALLAPLKWKQPRRVFVNSMSDLFHENVSDEMRDRIFAVMALCSQHTFQVLTKRPERMRNYIASLAAIPRSAVCNGRNVRIGCEGGWTLPNVWLGVSVENQKAADERIPLLLQTPASVRFISAEPLLGAVDLKVTATAACVIDTLNRYNGLNWVICGGESGPGARPMHPDWARSLRDQCQAAGVPFFFKQWGEWMQASEDQEVWNRTREDFETIPARQAFARVGKKAAGSLLDGREWKQYPGVSQ